MKGLRLFDVDYTLVHGKYGGAQYFLDVVREVHGLNAVLDWESIQGLTDRIVLRRILEGAGIKDQRLDVCADALAKRFERDFAQNEICLIEGAKDALDAMCLNYVLGHVTGNLETIAKMKMKRVGLDGYFAVGGYGSDPHEERYELIGIAIEKAKALGYNFLREDVVLFGDTPRDIEAGKKAGVKTVGVATGFSSVETLEKAGADLVIPNWKDIHGIVRRVDELVI